ncbi:YqhR family membrane protein [Jeotgalibacillus proteolyticus]|uniref:Uncharacterized protein n=1 Tax=Jeotgalibacillus proteolyticus TaxID=2082395 RepID=A0A2S5GEP8_9BACL|nr:YqhR family membrane protein [Jeotgalibacillus proteolyticus]PPA71384.1 hypothetical protein C4B60_04790 [Jeotgalibacillus proteolyticus]
MSTIETPTIKRTPLTLIIGLTGGILFCLVYEAFQFFNFIEKKTLMPSWSFLAPSWQKGIVAHVIWWGLICLISVIWALLYQLMIKKSDTMWPGIFINIVILAVIFGVFGWWLEMGPDITKLKHHASISIACLFILHGAFVGLSISYDEPYDPESDKETKSQ